MHNKWEPTAQHRELYRLLSGDLNGKEILKKTVQALLFVII